jgi:DNA-binding NtrC family response regulator
VFRINLELAKFDVREAATVADARELIAEARPALVFLDQRLGGESSDALLDELAAAGIPVVLATGAPDPDAFRGRASEVLPKPFEFDQVVSAARRLTLG